jgi:hypothetical protein
MPPPSRRDRRPGFGPGSFIKSPRKRQSEYSTPEDFAADFDIAYEALFRSEV